MFSLVRSPVHLQLTRIMRSAVHTTSATSTDRFSGKVKPPPDTDEGKKFSPEDYRQSAGYGIPKPGDDFLDRNTKLGRPMSPHIAIYQFQLPWLMSISHRVSGALLGVGLGFASLGILLAPHNFDYYVELIRSMHINQYLIFMVKLGAAWALTYHYLNGIRHLTWDMGQGFKLSQLYATGYVVLGLSLLTALYLAVQK